MLTHESAAAGLDPIDSRRLLTFTILAETMNMTDAARRMHLTRSAVSHALKALEDELGCELFVRNHKALSLSEAGERLLPHARGILESMEHARKSVV
jgi:LysR family transcriptional regulator, low CO2-responsive transcriptional regulator